MMSLLSIAAVFGSFCVVSIFYLIGEILERPVELLYFINSNRSRNDAEYFPFLLQTLPRIGQLFKALAVIISLAVVVECLVIFKIDQFSI